MSDTRAWCEHGGTSGRLHRPITEDWLRAHEFRIEDNRRDERLPVRRLVIGGDLLGGRRMFQSSDDLCIDVAPTGGKQEDWHVWIMQVEPYRHIHIRHMRYTWEIAALYSGLTGHIWPGSL